MEKEDIVKKMEDLEKKTENHGLKVIRNQVEKGNYQNAAVTLLATLSIYAPFEAEVKDLAKEIGALYVDLALDGIREKAAADRVSAKISLVELESGINYMGMDVPPKYGETKKFVYGLAPDQNESDEKIMVEKETEKLRESGKEMIAYARKAVRCGMLVVKSGDTPELVDNYLKAAKSIFDTAKDPLPPEYPENGDWRKTWKGDALEYIKDCINEAREILEYYRDRPAAKQSLDNANDYASYFGMALPPEYEDVRKLVGTVEQRSDGRLGKFFENIPGSAERAEKVYHIKVKNMREIIGDITTSGKLDDENIERAVVYLRNIKVTCKVYDQPMPPEFYKLKKLVNWKDPDEEPPAKLKTYDKHYYEDESKSLEELKEQKSGRRKESPYKYDSSEFEKAMDDMEGPLLRDIINEIKAGHADKPGLQTMRNNLNKIKKNREASEKTLSPEFYELDRLLTEMEGNAGTGSEDRYIELCIKDVKKYLHEKDGVWMAKTSLESAKTYAKSLGLPLPPEYDEAVKYVQEVERAAEPMRAGTKETRKIPLGPERTINQEEAYGLRKELEGSGNPKHAKAVEELRKGHYATAALLINTAEELDNAHVPSETLEPLYEEAVRDLLNGALAFENDPLILRSMLEDVKKYVSKVKELPEDLAALYEFLRKKAGC